MPLVNAKCTNCGGTLQVDAAKEAAVCPFCGSAFIVEKAIQNYNIVNNIQANVVNIYGAQQKDYVIKGGVLTKYKGESVNAVLPDTVHGIGPKAFADCKYLESVTFPSSLKSIEEGAFYRCGNLKEISFPQGLQSIGDCAFAFCNGLQRVKIPSSVKTVGHCAFLKCDSLTEAVFEEGVQTIGALAFYECPSLKKIVLPKSLKTVLPLAFYDCPNLTDVWYNGSLTELIDFCAESYHNASDAYEDTLDQVEEIFEHYPCPESLQDDGGAFDGYCFDYGAVLTIPSVKNLYTDGKLDEGTFTFPKECVEKDINFMHFTLLEGSDKIHTIVLPGNYPHKGKLSSCPICGSYKSISLFGKCKKCGTKFIREK